MSAMSRLATGIELGMAQLDVLVRLGYEPAPVVPTSELDVFDPERDTWAACEDCQHGLPSGFMVDGQCPPCRAWYVLGYA